MEGVVQLHQRLASALYVLQAVGTTSEKIDVLFYNANSIDNIANVVLRTATTNVISPADVVRATERCRGIMTSDVTSTTQLPSDVTTGL